MIPYKTTYEKTNSFLLCMDLQPYSHYCFLKILRILFDFLNNTYWVSLFQRNNSLIFRTGVSCFSVTFFYSTHFCCGGKANLVWFTLFYSTLLTLTDGWNDRQRNKYTCFAWAGGTSGQEFLVFLKHSFSSFSYPLLTDGSCVADTLRNLGAIRLCLCTWWLRITLTTNQQEVPKTLLHHQMNLPWPMLNNFQVCCTTADSICCCDCGGGEGGLSIFYGRGGSCHRSRGCRGLFFLITVLGG